MRIIKEGKSKKRKVFHGTCTECGAIVEAEEHDAVKEREDYLVKCPTADCSAIIILDQGKYQS